MWFGLSPHFSVIDFLIFSRFFFIYFEGIYIWIAYLLCYQLLYHFVNSEDLNLMVLWFQQKIALFATNYCTMVSQNMRQKVCPSFLLSFLYFFSFPLIFLFSSFTFAFWFVFVIFSCHLFFSLTIRRSANRGSSSLRFSSNRIATGKQYRIASDSQVCVREQRSNRNIAGFEIVAEKSEWNHYQCRSFSIWPVCDSVYLLILVWLIS
jgi:hypothetical protein